jgi:hypothetical protein
VTVIALMVIHYRAEHSKRKLEHIERMRALEVGRAYPGELKHTLLNLPQRGMPYLMALGIGVVVPLGVIVCAFLATVIGGFYKEVWMASGMVGLGAVIGGTVLAAEAFKMTAASESANSGAHVESKQFLDEDAYYVVSSRG